MDAVLAIVAGVAALILALRKVRSWQGKRAVARHGLGEADAAANARPYVHIEVRHGQHSSISEPAGDDVSRSDAQGSAENGKDG
jgi:hypothetical protein